MTVVMKVILTIRTILTTLMMLMIGVTTVTKLRKKNTCVVHRAAKGSYLVCISGGPSYVTPVSTHARQPQWTASGLRAHG